MPVSDIEDLKGVVEAKKLEAKQLRAAVENGDMDGVVVGEEQLGIPADVLAGMNAQQRAEAVEKRQREVQLDRIRLLAEAEQEQSAAETDLAQMMEILTRLEGRLARGRVDQGGEGERMRAQIEEEAAEQRREIEAKASQMEAELRHAEMEEAKREEVCSTVLTATYCTYHAWHLYLATLLTLDAQAARGGAGAALQLPH